MSRNGKARLNGGTSVPLENPVQRLAPSIDQGTDAIHAVALASLATTQMLARSIEHMHQSSARLALAWATICEAAQDDIRRVEHIGQWASMPHHLADQQLRQAARLFVAEFQALSHAQSDWLLDWARQMAGVTAPLLKPLQTIPKAPLPYSVPAPALFHTPQVPWPDLSRSWIDAIQRSSGG